jgi:tetratricopeptide (TPR) repeat protein
MKQNAMVTPLVTLVALALAGCAVAPGKQAWDVKPVMDVRHGMANSNAYYQLGRYQQSQGKIADAEALYQRAVAADPANVDALNALGALYAERGDLERSAELYRRVVDQMPQRAYLYNNVGYAYQLQGRYTEAIAAFRQALILAPGYERAWVNLRRAGVAAGLPEVVAEADQRHLAGQQVPEAVALAKAEPVIETSPASAVVAATPTTPSAPANEPELPSGPIAAVSLARNASAVSWILPSAKPTEVKPAAVVSRPAVRASRPILATEASLRPAAPAISEARLRLADSMVKSASVPSAIASQTSTVKAAMHSESRDAAMLPARLEVSNGNGVTGFAAGIRMHLKMLGVGVSRLSNFVHFRVLQTVIEYRPGYAAQAEALQARIGKPAVLREAKTDRAGTDIRVILGSDWTHRARVLGEAGEEDGKTPSA